MRSFLILLLLGIWGNSNGQTSKFDMIEKQLKKDANGSKFEKQNIDLNGDKIDDYIYFYGCGEPNCIKVYLDINGTLKEQISEPCYGYELYNLDNIKNLVLTLGGCCGESPYLSIRVFGFNQTQKILKENYVLTRDIYVDEPGKLQPKFYLNKADFGKVTIDNYNLRFSPTLEKFTKKDAFDFSCESGTNIIARIKIGTIIKILAETIERDRTWLFVEVDKEAIIGKCNPISFDFKDQKLRGWVSGKFVEKK